MNRIDKKFSALKKKKAKAFIAYVTAGDPSLPMTGKIVLELERSGADIIMTYYAKDVARWLREV